MVRPIGATSGNASFASCPLIIATNGASRRSASLKSRPANDRHLQRPEVIGRRHVEHGLRRFHAEPLGPGPALDPVATVRSNRGRQRRHAASRRHATRPAPIGRRHGSCARCATGFRAPPDRDSKCRCVPDSATPMIVRVRWPNVIVVPIARVSDPNCRRQYGLAEQGPNAVTRILQQGVDAMVGRIADRQGLQ